MPDTPPESGSDPPSSAPSATELNRQRDSSRRNLLRANTAVALVIATVLGLALAATWQSLRATRLQAAAHEQQNRAETAEVAARTELWRALVAESRATRLGQTLNRRGEALESIRRAAAIAPTAELRHEAVAALALPEYPLDSSLPLDVSVRGLEFDHEIRTCALGFTNGNVSIRRLADGVELRCLRLADGAIPDEQGAPLLMDFAPGGDLLSVRYQRGAFAVWEVGTGRALFVRDADQRRRPASRALFSSDGRQIVAPVFTPDGLEVMEARTGRTIAHFPEVGSFHHAAVRPGTNQFAAYDGTDVVVVDWSTRLHVAKFPFEGGARRLAWSPDGRRLAIVGNRLGAQVWTVDQQRVLELPGHKDDLFDVVFSASGEMLATSGFYGGSRIWDLRDGRVVGVSSDARLAQWGPDGRTGWVVSRERLEVRRQIPSGVFTGPVGAPEMSDGRTLDVSADGQWAVSTSRQGGLQVWNLGKPVMPDFIPLPDIRSFCFDPRESRLYLIRGHGLESRAVSAVTSADGSAGIELGPPNPLTGVPQRNLDLVTCSADGRTRAFVNLPGGAVWVEHLGPESRLVPIEDTEHSSVASFSGSARGTGTIAVSPDGRWLACGADGRHGTRVFDTSSGKPIAVVDDAMGGVQFSPDGRWLALAGARECRLFSVGDWKLVWIKPADPRNPNYSGIASFSPDGMQLVYAWSSRNNLLLDTATGRELAVLESPAASPATCLRWTADGQRLVAATRENTLDVWQPEVLRRELAGLGLDWDSPTPPAGRVLAAAPATVPDFSRWIAVGLFVTAGVVAAVALGSLRRHRRLIEDFSRTEALASKREQELEGEREVGRLKSRFISIVSHEFRTPLGIIMSAVELLRNYSERLTPAKRDELHGDIFTSTRQMAGLMEQVLVLGRVESGRVGFRPVPIDLPGVCARLTDESLSATNHRCRIEFRVEGSFEGAAGDEALLRHILSNLLSNAVKYSPPAAEVMFHVAREGDRARFTVRDRGIGIPEADLPHLFEAFRRASNVGDTPGTGLGLLIVKRCVDLQWGEVRVDSKPGAGTTVTVTLPLFHSA